MSDESGAPDQPEVSSQELEARVAAGKAAQQELDRRSSAPAPKHQPGPMARTAKAVGAMDSVEQDQRETEARHDSERTFAAEREREEAAKKVDTGQRGNVTPLHRDQGGSGGGNDFGRRSDYDDRESVPDGNGKQATIREIRTYYEMSRLSEERREGYFASDVELALSAEQKGWNITGRFENGVQGDTPVVDRDVVMNAFRDFLDGYVDGLRWESPARRGRRLVLLPGGELEEEIVVISRWLGLGCWDEELQRDLSRGETKLQYWERIKAAYKAMEYKYDKAEYCHQRQLERQKRGAPINGWNFGRAYGWIDHSTPDPVEQAVIRRVQAQCVVAWEPKLRCKGTAAMARTLNAEGIRNSNGKEWTKDGIRDLCQKHRLHRLGAVEATAGGSVRTEAPLPIQDAVSV